MPRLIGAVWLVAGVRADPILSKLPQRLSNEEVGPSGVGGVWEGPRLSMDGERQRGLLAIDNRVRWQF